MNKTVLHIGIGVVVLILQSTLANWISILNVKPDFLMLYVMFIAYREGKTAGILYGFCFGLLQDLTAASLFIGLSSLVNSIIGFGTGYLHRKFNVMNPVLLYIVAAGILLLGEAVYTGIYYASSPLAFGILAEHLILPTFLYTGIIGTLLIFVIPLQSEE